MVDHLGVALKIAASGIEAQSKRVRVVSENMANAESTGSTPGANPYMRQSISFEAELDVASGARLVKAGAPEPYKSPFRIEHNPEHPAADASGYVKLPNVNLMVELADMREANRSYEANLQVFKQARELVSITIDLLRS